MMYTRRDFEVTIETLRDQPAQASELVTATVALAELPTIFEELRCPSPHGKVLVAPQL